MNLEIYGLRAFSFRTSSLDFDDVVCHKVDTVVLADDGLARGARVGSRGV